MRRGPVHRPGQAGLAEHRAAPGPGRGAGTRAFIHRCHAFSSPAIWSNVLQASCLATRSARWTSRQTDGGDAVHTLRTEAPVDETVRFGPGATEYEIDLSKRTPMGSVGKPAPFMGIAARRAGQRRWPGRAASSRERSADIRARTKDQGITVSNRGRISASVAEQYKAATEGS